MRYLRTRNGFYLFTFLKIVKINNVRVLVVEMLWIFTWNSLIWIDFRIKYLRVTHFHLYIFNISCPNSLSKQFLFVISLNVHLLFIATLYKKGDLFWIFNKKNKVTWQIYFTLFLYSVVLGYFCIFLLSYKMFIILCHAIGSCIPEAAFYNKLISK